MHKPEFFLENQAHKVIRVFDIEIDHLISTRSPDRMIVNNNNNKRNKKTCRFVDFVVPYDHRLKIKESEKRDKYQDSLGNKKKLWNTKVTVIPIVIGALWTVPKGLVRELEEWEIRERTATIQTTVMLKSPRIRRGLLRKLPITQTPMKDHQLALVWKIRKASYKNVCK